MQNNPKWVVVKGLEGPSALALLELVQEPVKVCILSAVLTVVGWRIFVELRVRPFTPAWSDPLLFIKHILLVLLTITILFLIPMNHSTDVPVAGVVVRRILQMHVFLVAANVETGPGLHQLRRQRLVLRKSLLSEAEIASLGLFSRERIGDLDLLLLDGLLGCHVDKTN